MHTRTLGLILAALLVAAGACSPSSGNTGPATADQACSDFATNYCERLDTCSHYDLQLFYGTVAECVGRYKPVCRATLAASGTGLTPSQYEPCAQASKSLSCETLLSLGTPTECRVTGSLATGSVCGHDSQCTSGYCKIDFFQNCGTCTARVAIGSTCTRSNDCSGSAVCVSPGRCAAPAAAGQSCVATVCAGTLQCIGGTCSPPLTLGSPCTVNPDDCDTNAGLSCDFSTMRCVARTLAGVGQTCAMASDAGTAFRTGTATCIANSTCGQSNTCEAALPDGAQCDTGSLCHNPAQCVSGVCTLPNPAACH